MKTLNQIFDEFQLWLDLKNSKIHPVLIDYKGFLAPDEVFGVVREGQSELPNQHIPYPIQQVEKEIKEFVKILFKNLSNFNNALEIGMGEFGGTHKLFSLMFETITTIEILQSNIEKYLIENETDFLKDKFVCNRNGDQLLIDEYDMLFIDGDHSYQRTHYDYIYYSKFVKNNGIIGFHDANNPKYGVKKFLEDLSNGFIDGKNHIVNNICHSKETGISYIKKT